MSSQLHSIARHLIVLASLISAVILVPPTSASQMQVSIELGASAEDNSIGNIGVQAQIRTHTYNISISDLSDSFWVGDNLANSAFIQFGYAIFHPGYYCLQGAVLNREPTCISASQKIANGDARWFWEYFPNSESSNFYYAYGPTDSAGTNGTWHLYIIEPNSENGWNLLLDGENISSLPFPPSASADRAYVVAEKLTGLPATGQLGPVEFRNLAYLEVDGWHSADALYAIIGCRSLNQQCPNQSVPGAYGVSATGQDIIIAGSGVKQPKNEAMLWENESQTGKSTATSALLWVTIAAALLLIAGIISAAKRFRKRTQKARA